MRTITGRSAFLLVGVGMYRELSIVMLRKLVLKVIVIFVEDPGVLLGVLGV